MACHAMSNQSQIQRKTLGGFVRAAAAVDDSCELSRLEDELLEVELGRSDGSVS